MRSWTDRCAVAAGFAVLLILSWYGLGKWPGGLRSVAADWASTSVANLADHPFGALALSAVVPEGPLWQWLVLATAGLVATGWVLGWWRTALLVVSAHVVGTYVSEGILGYRVALHHAAPADLYLRDVGPSYVVIAGLAAGLAYGRWAGRVPSAVGLALMAPSSFTGLPRLEVASVGHVCAILVALGLGWYLRRDQRYVPSRSPLTYFSTFG